MRTEVEKEEMREKKGNLNTCIQHYDCLLELHMCNLISTFLMTHDHVFNAFIFPAIV